jgi:NADPH-dependent 2,4-dienoyl-CoA reductase/sulfur reductase-like enzyme
MGAQADSLAGLGAAASSETGDDRSGSASHDQAMPLSPDARFDVVVIGAGPAGVIAALRAARLGASTALITRDEFGGMAANDGPVPVRTLAQAARLIREARQLPRYGMRCLSQSG